MDTARVVHHDTGPSPGGPRRRRRWVVALALAGLAAPLTSGSAIALTGGSGGTDSSASPARSAPAVMHSSGDKAGKRHGRRCNRDKAGGAGTRGAYSPQL